MVLGQKDDTHSYDFCITIFYNFTLIQNNHVLQISTFNQIYSAKSNIRKRHNHIKNKAQPFLDQSQTPLFTITKITNRLPLPTPIDIKNFCDTIYTFTRSSQSFQLHTHHRSPSGEYWYFQHHGHEDIHKKALTR